MKRNLTPKQINFIENYLIKNKVKFWDVRLELLDHIATEMEHRMDRGESFDDALIEIHISFGNKYRSKRLNPERTQWIFTESLYADHSGYQKLIKRKQIELNKGFAKLLWKNLKNLFREPSSALLLFGSALGLWYLCYILTPQQIKTVIFLPVIIFSLLPLVVTGFFGLKKQRHLGINLLVNNSTFPLTLLNLTYFFPSAFGTELLPLAQVVIAFIALVLSVVQWKIIKDYVSHQKEFYLKWKAIN